MKLMQISLDVIDEPREQVRKVICSKRLEELSASIKKVGLIQPIIVKHVGEKYEVCYGHRRLLACRMANVSPIPCLVADGSVNDQMTMKLHENYFREDVNAADEAEFFSFMIEKDKMSIEALSQRIGKSGTYIRERLNLLRGDQVILEAVRDGQISAGIAKELNAIADEEIRLNYLHYAIDGGVTIRTAQEWRKQYERDSRTQELLDAGHTPEELPKLLPKYYYSCPMCVTPTELTQVRAVSVCGGCYETIMRQFQDVAKEAPKT